jgi:hypothetical protein
MFLKLEAETTLMMHVRIWENLIALRPNNFFIVINMKEYEKKTVLLLLSLGGVQRNLKTSWGEEWLYEKYGHGEPTIDRLATVVAITDLVGNDIDWKATGNVKSVSEHVFGGDDDPGYYATYHYVEVHSTTGAIYRFAYQFDGDDLINVVRYIDQLLTTEWWQLNFYTPKRFPSKS